MARIMAACVREIMKLKKESKKVENHAEHQLEETEKILRTAIE